MQYLSLAMALRVARRYLVAAIVFGFVQPAVGAIYECVRVSRVLRKRGEALADGRFVYRISLFGVQRLR